MRPVTLGSGAVTYHPSRPVVHFGNAHEVDYTPTSTFNLEITKELPNERKK